MLSLSLDSTPAPATDVMGVLLAAGYARRFGGDKRRLPWLDGSTLMQAALRPLQANCSRVVVVLPPGDVWGLNLCRQHHADVVWSFNRAAGLAASLSAAVPAVRLSSAIVVGLADMGNVQNKTVAQLIECWRQHPDQPVLPKYGAHLGNPRLIPASLFHALRNLSGDDGVRHAIDWGSAHTVNVCDPGVVFDIDHPSDVIGQEKQGL